MNGEKHFEDCEKPCCVRGKFEQACEFRCGGKQAARYAGHGEVVGAFYFQAVAWCVGKGYLQGVQGGEFKEAKTWVLV